MQRVVGYPTPVQDPGQALEATSHQQTVIRNVSDLLHERAMID